MFIRNAWYIAGWSDEVIADRPFARVMLNEPVVLWRQPDGTPVALEDRCCHRALPLSMGKIVGDRLQCGYHGLEFDAAGNCAQVPGQSTIPPGASVRHYPAVERHRWIWVWMGDAEVADPALIPDFHWLDTPGWVAPTGTFHLKAHYQYLVDNLLDFSHVQFIHRNTIGTDAIADIPSTVEKLEDGVAVQRWIPDSPPPPLFDNAYGGFGGNVDRWMNNRYTVPSSVTFDIGCAAVGTGAADGDRSQGVEIRSLHGITPETETSSHYFWAYARNFRLDDEDLSALLAKGAHATFEEDVIVLGEQQKSINQTGESGLVDINGDAPGMLGRRVHADRLAADAFG